MDLLIRQTKTEIINLLNGKPLPIEVKRLLLAEVLSEVSMKSNEIINQQLADERADQEEKDNG